MNIKEAKEEIKHTLLAYHSKDTYGNYRYPLLRQRPILLIGPPGIGKTAVMEQIAEECEVGLVSYTMTHHTRQSAIGLPRIVTRNYGGTETTVTEYTLSEIIASVYDCMERTGKKEGILFIDEINCVSETLAPTMLQFLQNKMFGSHKVPEGWMIVAAGNPPEYNKSVREFDIVTLDRVRRIDIEADSEVWMEYAWKQQLHGAILSYINLKKNHFYVVENTADGKYFVTARGWEDLSQLLKSYEELGIEITENLTIQYLQQPEIAADFTTWYRLYRKNGTDYRIPEILAATLPSDEYQEKVTMAQNAGFSERFTLISLLLESLNLSLEDYEKTDRQTILLHEALQLFLKNQKIQQTPHILKGQKTQQVQENQNAEQNIQRTDPNAQSLQDFITKRKEALKVKQDMELITPIAAEDEQTVIRHLQQYDFACRENHITTPEQAQNLIRNLFSKEVTARTRKKQTVQQSLQQAFTFTAACFGEEKEMLLLVTTLTRIPSAMRFIKEAGCAPYTYYSAKLITNKSDQQLQDECRRLLAP